MTTMQETQEMQKYQETQLYWASWYLRCCIKEEAKCLYWLQLLAHHRVKQRIRAPSERFIPQGM